MEFTPAVAADLAFLSATLFDPRDDLATDLAATVQLLAADTRLAVQSFLGLTVTVNDQAGAPARDAATGATDAIALRFTVPDDRNDRRQVRASLRLMLPADGSAQPNISVIFYASNPGAFVDLAADLSFLTGHDLSDAVVDQHLGLASTPDIVGRFVAASAVNEAIGVLMDRDRTREQAVAELDRLAAVAGTDREFEANRLLAGLVRPAPEPEAPVLT